MTSALLLVLYDAHGDLADAPGWWLKQGRELTGIVQPKFHQHAWSHASALVLLMLVPLGLAWRIEGLNPRALGLGVRGARREFLLVLALWLAFLPVLWLFSGTPDFQRVYPRFPPAETDAFLFWAYEIAYLVKWTAWEFFFRGFMLFALLRVIGTNAVVVSTIPFVLMHFGKPEPEVLGALVAGPLLCWLALRSRSIWPGVCLHWACATSMDFFASSWWR